MRKLLLTLAVLCGTVSAWAGVTDLPEMSTEGNIKWYTIKNTRSTSGSYLYWAGDNVGVKDSNTKTSKSFFYFTGTAEACYIHNAMTDKLFASETSWTESGTVCTISETPHSSKAGVSIGFKGTFLNEQNQADGYTTWGADDAGSIFVIEPATEEDITNAIKAEKDAAISKIDNLLNTNLSIIYKAETLNTLKSTINALGSGFDAAKALHTAMRGIYSQDKYFIFQTKATDNHRNGVYIGVPAGQSNSRGTTEAGYPAMWRLEGTDDGNFYLYNSISNSYIGTPTSNALMTASPSAIYSFEVIDATANVVELKCSSQTLHASNHTDDKLLNWDGNEDASRWIITEANLIEEINKQLDANSGNHAETPALGQYSDAAYSTLESAKETVKSPSDAQNAITTFKASLNRPVYFITSLHDGYAKGSAILYNGSQWRWATANIYNKQMWMTIPGYTQPDVPVVDAYDVTGTNYEICDYLTGTVMRDKKVQIVKITGWDGAYNLQYNADANSTDAAQHAKDNEALVNWKPATTTDSKASAWHVEYIGNSFDLDKLTEEKIEAIASMRVAYDAKVYCKDAVLGNGLGQYQGDKEAIVAALTKAEKSLVELANMTIEDINAITDEINATAALIINQPIAGNFYRIKGGKHTSLPNHYITANTNSDGGRIALKADGNDASTVYYYADGKLLAYGSGLYFGLSSSHHVFATVDGTKPASEITFAASPREAGAYTIKSADRYVHYKVYNGEAEIDRCADDVHAEHDWFLEEVTSLPFTFKAAALGFATFNAPVAVELPEGISAYIGELNIENNTLQMYKFDGNQIPANTAVLLRKEGVTEDATVNFTIVSNAEEDFGGVTNSLVGTVAAENLDDTKNCYSLQKSNTTDKVGFYSKTSGTKGGFKAWLETDKAVGARVFTIIFDGEDATGIKEALGLENENVEIYDLSGRRLDKPAKGVNIIGGKTVIVR